MLTRNLALLLLIFVTGTTPALGVIDCQYADIQAKDVDFDQAQQWRGREVSLDIPEHAVIGEIVIERRKIFDLAETGNGWFYSLSNEFHILTRESALRAQLLFESGDPYIPADLAETERALRDQSYLLDAWVQPFRVCGNKVDIVVVTRDVWTLRPDLGFARAGGETKTSIGFTDDNFLGLGKSLAIKRQSGPDQDRTFVEYIDPNVLGSRWTLAALIADASDGDEQSLYVARPFYEFGTSWAAIFDARHDDHITEFYFRGDEVSAFRDELVTFGAFGGLSLGVEDKTDHRLLFGYRYTENKFAPVPGRPSPAPFPQDRTLSFPYIGFELLENRFVETVNMTRIQRIEDVREGIRLRAIVGWSDNSLGADEDRLIVETSLRDAVVFNPNNLFDYTFRQRGWYNTHDDQVENLELSWVGRYFLGGSEGERSWFASLELAAAKNFTADRRFSLGGEGGLRGYPYRYQIGDRRVLLQLERRYYTDWHPFNLFRVGGVVFFDAGRAWYHDRDNGLNGDWLTDVGFGLRIASDRYSSGTILHVDLAFPLNGGNDIDNVQLIVRGEATF